jgi:hypothetical protein
VALHPEFSKSLDLTDVPADDLIRIVAEIDSIATSMESIPRHSAVWLSLSAGRLIARVNRWTVEYVVDENGHRLVVTSISAK